MGLTIAMEATLRRFALAKVVLPLVVASTGGANAMAGSDGERVGGESVSARQLPRFLDITDAVGLGPQIVGTSISRVCFADLTGNGWPDAIVDRHRVFLNVPAEAPIVVHVEPSGEPVMVHRRFVELAAALEAPGRGDSVVFADLDNDGHLDAILIRHVDVHNPNWIDDGPRTAWRRGNGDGTFGPEQAILAAVPATSAAVAVGDVNRNGRLDLWIGNWYTAYGRSLDAYNNDLLLQVAWSEIDGSPRWTWQREPLPSDGARFTTERDAGGRPTYGVLIADLDDDGLPELLELNYGRRWNRCWTRLDDPDADNLWLDIAPQAGLDGDAIRHGRHPQWALERFRERGMERQDELPFRANGNTFDGAVGDIDNNGAFDLFVAEITHGWAGDSSDRSRFLLNRSSDGEWRFVEDPRLSVDRIPPDRESWNQGDLFAELADFDHDGRLDLLLSSGDYPDDQRLRLYLQADDGTFRDVSLEVGLDHDGSQQIALGDVTGNGALDILVGQTFFRYTSEMREGREPRLRLFMNLPSPGRRSLTLRLVGDPQAGTNRDALGAIVEAKVNGLVQRRQLLGIGGHAGKQHDFLLHFGLGEHERIETLTVIWPNARRERQTFENVGAGRYRLEQGGTLERLSAPAP